MKTSKQYLQYFAEFIELSKSFELPESAAKELLLEMAMLLLRHSASSVQHSAKTHALLRAEQMMILALKIKDAEKRVRAVSYLLSLRELPVSESSAYIS